MTLDINEFARSWKSCHFWSQVICCNLWWGVSTLLTILRIAKGSFQWRCHAVPLKGEVHRIPAEDNVDVVPGIAGIQKKSLELGRWSTRWSQFQSQTVLCCPCRNFQSLILQAQAQVWSQQERQRRTKNGKLLWKHLNAEFQISWSKCQYTNSAKRELI